MSKKIVLITLVVILLLVNWSIYQKEEQLTNGMLIYLELAPIDPRSLMQGDYMALRYTLSRDIEELLLKNKRVPLDDGIKALDGKVIVSLDTNSMGTFKALYSNQILLENDILVHYRVRNGKVKLATNAFFFQEGDAKLYEKAKYGAFRVKDTHPLLVHMYDKNLQILGHHLE